MILYYKSTQGDLSRLCGELKRKSKRQETSELCEYHVFFKDLFFFIFIFAIHVYICASVCTCTCMWEGSCRGQKKVMDPSELELQGFVSCQTSLIALERQSSRQSRRLALLLSHISLVFVKIYFVIYLAIFG